MFSHGHKLSAYPWLPGCIYYPQSNHDVILVRPCDNRSILMRRPVFILNHTMERLPGAAGVTRGLFVQSHPTSFSIRKQAFRCVCTHTTLLFKCSYFALGLFSTCVTRCRIRERLVLSFLTLFLKQSASVQLDCTAHTHKPALACKHTLKYIQKKIHHDILEAK